MHKSEMPPTPEDKPLVPEVTQEISASFSQDLEEQGADGLNKILERLKNTNPLIAEIIHKYANMENIPQDTEEFYQAMKILGVTIYGVIERQAQADRLNEILNHNTEE